MIELDDVGSQMILTFVGLTRDYQVDLKIQMVIKAPRGIMVLYDHNYISPDTQCEAIRAFMEEHSDD